MSLGFLGKGAVKAEIARLEKIKEAFMTEHTALCEKYHCQLVPVPQILPGGLIRFSLQLDSYQPAEKKKQET